MFLVFLVYQLSEQKNNIDVRLIIFLEKDKAVTDIRLCIYIGAVGWGPRVIIKLIPILWAPGLVVG